MTYGGDIEGFPPEVVELMLQRQYERHGWRDVSFFEACRTAGFAWMETPEGRDFWSAVIGRRQFDVFFKRYPSQSGSTLNYRSWE